MKEGTYELKSTYTGYDNKDYDARYVIIVDEDGDIVTSSGEYFDEEWKDTHEDRQDIKEMMLDEKENWIKIV